MRILLYGLNYAPELTGIGKYSGEMAEWLAQRGHEVRVVTTPPYYPEWKVDAPYRWWAYRVERGVVRVYRCPLYVPQRPSGLTRLVHLLSFAVSSSPLLLRLAFWRPDVVMTVEPAFFCAPGTLLTAWLTGAASWLHVQDFELDAAFELGFLPAKGRVHRWALAVERWLLRRFSRVSTISQNMVDRLIAKGVAPERALLFPNWVNVDQIVPETGHNAMRAQLGIGADKIVLLYSGNMGMKQGLELLPELAQRLAGDPRMHFVFCGNGAFRPQLEMLVAGLGNVTLLRLQPLERLSELLSAADIHLLPQRAGAADLVMPSKLTGMLASGRPVIATAVPGTQVALALEGCGIAVEPGNTDQVVEAILFLAASPGTRARMGAAARQHALEHMGRDGVLGRFETYLQQAARDPVVPQRSGKTRDTHDTVET